VNHLQVLQEVAERGLRLSVAGQDLRLQGPQQRVDPELVGRIKAVKAELVAHLSAAQPAGPAGSPLTLLQRGYLIGRDGSVEMGNVASHVYHEIDGCWDAQRLQVALRAVVARHGMLRTRFTAEGRQVEQPAADVTLGVLDLRGEPEQAQQARLAALREERSHRILPSDRAPMLAADLTLLADDRMRLHVGHDGLVMDGISMFLFFDEWWRAYQQPGEPGGGDGVPFGDYVASVEAMRSKAPAKRSRDYWLDRLGDLPPHPALPLRTSPAAITRPRFVQHAARLDRAAWTALKARASAAGVTPTVVLLAAYAETLARWGGGQRFTLTTTVANRPPIHPRIADAIGNFSETLLVAIDLDRTRTFAERARALQDRLRRDLDHRHFSGIEVLRELARRDGADARMPFTFNSAIGYVRAGLDGSTLELFGPEVYTSSQTPQVWLNGFAFEQHGGVVVQFDEVAGLFPDGMIRAMVDGYAELLDSLPGEAAWAATTFDLLPAAQRARRRAANDTATSDTAAGDTAAAATASLRSRLLPEAFLAWAAADPSAPAVLTSDGTLTYGELAGRAAAAADWLRARQTRRDELIGLVMHRGPEQIVGILAALLAGGAYLPIDAGLPAGRVRYMLHDGRVRHVLTNAAWRGSCGDGVAVLDLEPAGTAGPAPAGPPAAEAGFPLPGAGPDDLAYVLYTSGTTGEPKGVMVSHRSVTNVVADCNSRFGVGPADRFFAISAFNFDLSVYDVFGALSAGASLVMPDAARAADPAHWLELAGRFGVTVWNSVPAIAALLAEQAGQDGAGGLARMRLVMMSGDRIPPGLPAALWRVKPRLTLMSLGGPTETTIWNVLHPIGDGPDDRAATRDGSEARIPYGKPNANNRAYILDADGLDTPDWVTGEICAAGVGLARGYWADDARTAARFWFDERRGERLYRTGDLGRYLPDGNIDIAGRSDFQIKVNGYRIEAGEVETRLSAIHTIKQAVVVRQPGARGDRLVAHLVPAGDDRPTEERIRQALAEHLPAYMLPGSVVWHESLPLTPNGKVDRKALTAAAAGAGTGGPSTGGAGPGGPGPEGPASPETAALRQDLAQVWAAVLRVPAESIEPGADFYDLGGDSLAAARIFTGVRKRFGVSITLDRLHEVRTVAAMAALVEAGAR
jgi:amino acid adenylation domain-containing protein